MVAAVPSFPVIGSIDKRTVFDSSINLIKESSSQAPHLCSG